MQITCNQEISLEEQQAYVDFVTEKYADRKIIALTINIGEDDYVDLKCEFEPDNFERIRRITGYLVGTLDRFCDGKRAEESERVKHTLS